MKNKFFGGVFIMAAGLLAAPTAHSQGTVYISSLGQPSSGSLAVASDSWQADMFETGNNPGGYALDSIELDMTPATGDPAATRSSFTRWWSLRPRCQAAASAP